MNWQISPILLWVFYERASRVRKIFFIEHVFQSNLTSFLCEYGKVLFRMRLSPLPYMQYVRWFNPKLLIFIVDTSQMRGKKCHREAGNAINATLFSIRQIRSSFTLIRNFQLPPSAPSALIQSLAFDSSGYQHSYVLLDERQTLNYYFTDDVLHTESSRRRIYFARHLLKNVKNKW